MEKPHSPTYVWSILIIYVFIYFIVYYIFLWDMGTHRSPIHWRTPTLIIYFRFTYFDRILVFWITFERRKFDSGHKTDEVDSLLVKYRDIIRSSMSNEITDNSSDMYVVVYERNSRRIRILPTYPYLLSTLENRLLSRHLISSHTCGHMRYRCVSSKYLRRSTMRIL